MSINSRSYSSDTIACMCASTLSASFNLVFGHTVYRSVDKKEDIHCHGALPRADSAVALTWETWFKIP